MITYLIPQLDSIPNIHFFSFHICLVVSFVIPRIFFVEFHIFFEVFLYLIFFLLYEGKSIGELVEVSLQHNLLYLLLQSTVSYLIILRFIVFFLLSP